MIYKMSYEPQILLIFMITVMMQAINNGFSLRYATAATRAYQASHGAHNGNQKSNRKRRLPNDF